MSVGLKGKEEQERERRKQRVPTVHTLGSGRREGQVCRGSGGEHVWEREEERLK